MAKLLQINPVVRENTSTGKIMREIGDMAIASGWESYIAYSKARDGIPSHNSKLVPVGDKFDLGIHWMATRLFDAHGLASKSATKKFIKKIREIDPDIVHIHNLHGYFLNYPLLLDFLAEYGRPVVWTIHDCWLFTGHCYHYDAVGCNKWQTGCGKCPQKREFPKSWIVDASARNFSIKSSAFAKMKNLTLVTVSEWMKGEVAKSFLKDKPCKVIHNGIDLSVFQPCSTEEVKAKYGISDKQIILGVASIWSAQKGLKDLIQIAEKLSDEAQLVIVGRTEDALPSSAIHVPRTENAKELAALYSLASVLVNTTYQDNYPTVNLESIACGTPVITYATGGSGESISPETGFIVPQGDIDAVVEKVKLIIERGKAGYNNPCVEYAKSHFDKDKCFADYLKLYGELL